MLEQASFNNCNLQGAIFNNTNLKSADLRTAINFNIDPEDNKLLKAKFSRNNIEGLLRKHQIVVE